MPRVIPREMIDFAKLKPRNEIETHTHISLRHDYIFFQISKAASSTVKFHLQTAEYAGTHFCVQNVNNKYLSPHLSPFQVKESTFISMINNKSIKKFTFVRNPYTRILSCYLHRIIGENSPSRKRLYKQLRRPESATVSFADFIHFICDQASPEMDSHWRVQTDDILWDFVDFDMIGKVENLVADLLALEAMIFGRETFDREKLAAVNLAPAQTNAVKHVHEFYDDRLMEHVADRFGADFVAFDYSMELPG